MAAFDTTRPSTILPAGFFSRFVGQIGHVIADWNDARVTRKALSQLTNRELDDIGLVRGDIENIARRTR